MWKPVPEEEQVSLIFCLTHKLSHCSPTQMKPACHRVPASRVTTELLLILRHGLLWSPKAAGTDKDWGDMGSCKSIQEEIKAGFLVAVLSPGRLHGRQKVKEGGKIPFKATCLWECSYLEKVWSKYLHNMTLSAWKNTRPMGERRWQGVDF